MKWANPWDAIEECKRLWGDRLQAAYGFFTDQKPTLILFVDDKRTFYRQNLFCTRKGIYLGPVDIILASPACLTRKYRVRKHYPDIASSSQWVKFYSKPPPDDFLGDLR